MKAARNSLFIALAFALIFIFSSSGFGDTDSLYVSDTGNVGVGTTTPQAKLDVAGDVQIGDGKMHINSTVGDNFSIKTKTNTPNPSFSL